MLLAAGLRDCWSLMSSQKETQKVLNLEHSFPCSGKRKIHPSHPLVGQCAISPGKNSRVDFVGFPIINFFLLLFSPCNWDPKPFTLFPNLIRVRGIQTSRYNFLLILSSYFFPYILSRPRSVSLQTSLSPIASSTQKLNIRHSSRQHLRPTLNIDHHHRTNLRHSVSPDCLHIGRHQR